MKPPEIPLFGRIIIAVIVSILVVFSTLGNTLVLCVLNRKRTSSQQSQRKTESVVQCYGKHHSLQTSMIGITLAKRSVTYIFLVNLSLSDLLHILICAPFTLVADFLLIYWPFGGILCRLVNYLQGVVVFICAFTHVIISIDRLTAVRCPIWRRRNLSVTNARMILLLIWCCAMIISIPSLIVCQIIVDKDGLTHCQEVWSETFMNTTTIVDLSKSNFSYLTNGSLVQFSISLFNPKVFEEFNDSNQISLELIYNWLIILFQYILPLFVIIITYSAIICQIWISTIPGEGNVHRIERSRASRKLIKMVIIVASLYAISQLPRHIIYLITMNKPDAFERDTIIYSWLLCQLSAWSATCYNPIVYIWMSRTFRRELSEIFNNLCFCSNVHNTTQYTFKQCDKHYSRKNYLYNSKHNHNLCDRHLQSHNQRRYFPYSKAATYNCNSSNNNISQVKSVEEHIVDEEYSSTNTQYFRMKILDNTKIIKMNNDINNQLKL
ncbi:unnamed protein product [Schistosoma rodhaini]|uniref:Putative g-protein coupled receptor n=2 Tax=Schistosoma mansoni TaxID=6183 RepID=A0A3Q0KSW6_SCHMA|nr:unnamed protein product [Schistosoma rodhaini]